MFCSKCGKENADGAGFCGSCGAPLKREEATSTPSNAISTEFVKKSDKKNGRLIGIVAAVVVVVVVIVAGIATEGFGLLGPKINFDPKDSVNSYSWEELSEISNAIGAASSDEKALDIAKQYNLTNPEGKLDGTQTKSIQLTNGKQVDVQIAGFHHDEKSDGGKAGFTFIFKDAIAEHQMNPTDINVGGWEGSQMRTWLSTEGMDMLPSDLTNLIVEVDKKTNNSGETQSLASVTTTKDKLWLFSLTELCGFNEQQEQHASYFEDWINGVISLDTELNLPQEAIQKNVSGIKARFEVWSAEGNEYKLFKDQSVDWLTENSILQKSYNGSLCQWWERSIPADSNYAFNCVSDDFVPEIPDGFPGDSHIASRSLAVVPGFCI